MNIPEKPEHVTWTSDQWKAIHASGKDILVAAAAGSGKTAVLVERIIQRLLNTENPINVDELLVATFTNQAAAEMRQRIAAALEKEIAANPTSTHLRRQLSLLNHATISTLHAFCLDVVRKYYYFIDIDPGFRIMDETEGVLLRDEALEELLEEEYGKEGNEAYFQVVDMFSSDRSDEALHELITKLYEFSRATPDPEYWLETLVQMYDVREDMVVDDLPFIEPLLEDIEIQLQEAKRLFQKAYELTLMPGGPDKRAENFLDDLHIVETLIHAKQESFQLLYDAFQTVEFSRLKPCKGDEYDQELLDRSKNIREDGKRIITNLKSTVFSRQPETYLKDLRAMKEPIQTLTGLVRKFSYKFNEKKKEKGLVDFADLEHFALNILSEKDEATGKIIPSDVAKQYQQKFKEVFVDEYQDTNMVQEAILQLIKKPTEENGNLFMVGDVKQSIYRFRLAEPRLFLDKYLRFTLDGEHSGLRIDLSQNFRSRKEVLAGTNFIFQQVMDTNIGEIEYDEAAQLKKGAAYPEDEAYPIELALIYKEGDDDVEITNAEDEEEDFFSKEELEQSQMEARYVAKQIRKLIDTKQQVYDVKKKSYRPIEYRDIVVLFRSFTWVPQFMEEFKDYGIPVYAEISTGYFEAAEVATMLSLLKVIDNPYQDIPLVSVLRSPIVRLTEEELAQIRLLAKKVPFYEAVKRFCQEVPKTALHGQIQAKVEPFLHYLYEWRSLARTGSLTDLIWQLYRDTKFYEYVGGLPGGKQRQANLRALYDRAKQYESTSFRGLFRFLRFIERMKEQDKDLGVARTLGEKEDVVRIMTIHSSKGLEFPVVFICALGRKFNKQDLRKSYLFDKEVGVAIKYINTEKQITYPSLIQMAVQRKKQLETIAEEMRVLYVALTRAKEKLYLIGSCKAREKLLEKWQKHIHETDWLLSDFDRLKSETYLEWIAPSLIRHRDGENLRNTPLDIKALPALKEIYHHPSEWRVHWISDTELEEALEEERSEESLLTYVKAFEPVPIESLFKDQILEQLLWRYPHQSATRHRSKQSVSEIKRLKEVRDEYSGLDIISTFKKPITSRPKFMQEKKLSPAEKGTAMHRVMQHIDLTKKPTFESVQEQLIRMEQKELLTEEEINEINVDEIVHFFDTEIGLRILGADWVKREVPFSFSVSPKEIYADWKGKEDIIFVQGMIDCLFHDANGLFLLDYKTDQITHRFPKGFEEAKEILLNRYETQVKLYRRAVEQILKKKVVGTYLYFFDGGYLLTVE